MAPKEKEKQVVNSDAAKNIQNNDIGILLEKLKDLEDSFYEKEAQQAINDILEQIKNIIPQYKNLLISKDTEKKIEEIIIAITYFFSQPNNDRDNAVYTTLSKHSEMLLYIADQLLSSAQKNKKLQFDKTSFYTHFQKPINQILPGNQKTIDEKIFLIANAVNDNYNVDDSQINSRFIFSPYFLYLFLDDKNPEKPYRIADALEQGFAISYKIQDPSMDYNSGPMPQFKHQACKFIFKKDNILALEYFIEAISLGHTNATERALHLLCVLYPKVQEKYFRAIIETRHQYLLQENQDYDRKVFLRTVNNIILRLNPDRKRQKALCVILCETIGVPESTVPKSTAGNSNAVFQQPRAESSENPSSSNSELQSPGNT